MTFLLVVLVVNVAATWLCWERYKFLSGVNAMCVLFNLIGLVATVLWL